MLRNRLYSSFICLTIAALLCGNSPVASAADEITFPNKDFAKLDTFEGLNLQDADKLFNKKDYKGAYAAYKAFSFEFERSKALPYVLLRMGRCLHLLEKRNAAIKAYQDVVDYFPDDVRYAATALYYIGQCHEQNGDVAKQTAVWARMVKDDGYVTQPLSGTALAFLGQAMAKLGKHDEAAEYNWRTAVAFLKSNPRAAQDAREAVIFHYVMRKPDHDKLKKFYVEASGFDGRGHKIDKPESDARYWDRIFDIVLKSKVQAETKEAAAAYWAAKFGAKFPEHDDLRKEAADLQYVVDKDRDGWFGRLEKQFATQPASIDRVLKWCGYYKVDPKARSAFFAKHTEPMISGMDAKERIKLVKKLHHPHAMHDELKRVLPTIDTRNLTDEELADLGHFAARYVAEDDVMRYFARLKDKLFATKQRFDYYNQRSHRNPPNMEKALAEIPELEKAPKYAGGIAMAKAKLLHGLGRHEEAIKAYRAANDQPNSTWGETDCLIAMKNYGGAIKVVQQLEGLGGGVAAQAALKVADIHKLAGNKGKEVQQLRLILTRYKKSGQASTAHNRLESYGVALTGGEAEAED